MLSYRQPIKYGKAEVIYKERDIMIMAVGSMVKEAELTRDILKSKGYNVTLVNARFVKPFDEECIMELASTHKLLVTMEENILNGGFGEEVLKFANNVDLKLDVLNIAVPNIYLEQGNVDILRKEVGLDAESMAKRIEAKYTRVGL